MSEFSKEDVLSIARRLHFYPTANQIQEVLDRIEEEAELDPTGDWNLWMENIMYDIEVQQIVPPKYSNSNPLPVDADQPLVDKVLEEMGKEFRDENSDLTAIEELIKFIPVEYLKGFLPE